jgi:DNA-binding response OmpR family regulator
MQNSNILLINDFIQPNALTEKLLEEEFPGFRVRHANEARLQERWLRKDEDLAWEIFNYHNPAICIIELTFHKKKMLNLVKRIIEKNANTKIIYLLKEKASVKDWQQLIRPKAFMLIDEANSIDAVLKRLRSVLKIKQAPPREIQIGRLKIDTQQKLVWIADELITDIEGILYDVLEYLAIEQERTVTSRELLDNIWQGDPEATKENLQKYISQLRKYIYDNGNILIDSIRFGYKLNIVYR